MVSGLSHFFAPLFVPANRPERFAKAAASGADAIILDLEDAVARDAKDAARAALSASFTSLPVLVRINAVGTPWFSQDIAAIAALPAVAGVMLPKAEATSIATLAGQTDRAVVALIESARGLADARIVAAHPAVTRLAFGSIDYAADIGSAHTRETLLFARCEIVLASRLAGLVAPLDGVTTVIDDAGVTEAEARYARDLGFGGKLCIHPKQIAPTLAGFAPTEAEIAWARKVIASGDGAANVDGAMIDEPVRIRARRILGQG